MASRLVNMFVQNVSAVDRAANKRKFLVVKSADAMTFDDAMLNQRLHMLYAAVGERYGALMETMDSIRRSADPKKGPAIKTALESFVKSMQEAVPSMLQEMMGDDEKDMKKAGRKISSERMSKLVALRKILDDIITEGDDMSDNMNKNAAPDAGALTKIGHAIAAMFGRAAGASDETIASLEKAASGEPEVKLPDSVTTLLTKMESTLTDVTTRLEKAEQKATTLEEENKKLKDDISLRRFADEVAGFKDIGLDPEKDAVLLKAVDENLTKEQSERVREILKSAVAAKAATNLFGEVGSSGAGLIKAGSASAELEQAIDDLVAKNDKVTREQAQDAVFRAKPMLYERWRQETSVKV